MTRFLALFLAATLCLALPAEAAGPRRPSDELILLASQEGMLDLLHQRLDGGAYIDSVDYRGRTPLMLAARGGHMETVEALLRRGAEVERVDFQGDSAAVYALRRGHITVLHLILGWTHGTSAYRRQLAKTLQVARRANDVVTERRLRELYEAADAEPLRPAVAEGRWPRQDAISTDPLVRWLPWGNRSSDEDLPPAPPSALTPASAGSYGQPDPGWGASTTPARAPARPAAFQPAPAPVAAPAAPVRPVLPPAPQAVPTPLSDLPPIQ